MTVHKIRPGVLRIPGLFLYLFDMKNLLISVILLCTLSFAGYSQGKVVKGRVIDRKTREPVVAANVILPDGTGTHSGEEGRFEVKIDKFPTALRISHISYTGTVIYLDAMPKGEVLAELDVLVSEIGEVEITARRLRILTEKEDYSLRDFAFDNEFLWLLAYTNNQAGKGRLMLSGWFSDTITSIPVENPESLYRDVFGTAYLVMKDSVYQLFGGNRRIELPYAMDRTAFFALMDPIRAGFAGKLVYADIDPWERRAEVYYREAYVPGRQMLTVMEDALGRRDKKLENWVGSMWTEAGAAYGRRGGSRRGSTGDSRPGAKVETMISNPMNIPVFTRKDTLYTVNPFVDSLLVYGPDGKFIRSVLFTECREKLETITGTDFIYHKINALNDPIGHGTYLLERRGTAWILKPLDLSTGKSGIPVQLPEYPDMSNITVYAGAVYFLYPEKKWPFYVRLFRYQS